MVQKSWQKRFVTKETFAYSYSRIRSIKRTHINNTTQLDHKSC